MTLLRVRTNMRTCPWLDLCIASHAYWVPFTTIAAESDLPNKNNMMSQHTNPNITPVFEYNYRRFYGILQILKIELTLTDSFGVLPWFSRDLVYPCQFWEVSWNYYENADSIHGNIASQNCFACQIWSWWCFRTFRKFSQIWLSYVHWLVIIYLCPPGELEILRKILR